MLEKIVRSFGLAVLFGQYGCSTTRALYPLVENMNVKIVYFCSGEIEFIDKKIYCDGKPVYPLVIRNYK